MSPAKRAARRPKSTTKPTTLVPRKAAPKPKARPAAPKPAKGAARVEAIPKVCPICGSKRLDVRKADGRVKAAVKAVAGMALPVVVRVHPEIDCLSCGWRSEATY